MIKKTLINVYNYLANDSALLNLLGLTSNSSNIDDLIVKTRQSGAPVTKAPRLGIWEDKPEELNRRVDRHFLVVDVVVPLQEQMGRGLGLDLAKRVKEVLRNKPIGTKLHYLATESDLPIGYGWHKISVRFTYNQVGK